MGSGTFAPQEDTEIDHGDTYSLLAEIALGLAGFTGIAAAFGGHDRVYSFADQLRLLGIFSAAGTALVGSLCGLTLLAADLAPATASIWTSIVVACVLIPPNVHLVPGSLGLVRDPAATTRAWIFILVVVQLVLCLGLVVGNVLVWRDDWPLTAIFSIQLVWGLFLFARMLTVRH